MTKEDEAELQAILMESAEIVSKHSNDIQTAFMMIGKLSGAVAEALELVKQVSDQNVDLTGRLEMVKAVPVVH